MAHKLEGLAKDVFKKKYQQPTDRHVLDMWDRVATNIASVEQDNKWIDKFYDLLTDFKFIPGGRINAGAGTKNNYLLNCAVLPVEDSIEGIYEAIKQAAVLAKCNYGVGFDFSSIRPSDDTVSRGGSASGPVSFMRVFDTSGAIIETGGGRRAASIAVLRVDHPNIFEFIDAKRQEGVLTQFNISVGITTAFLDAVKAGRDFDLTFDGRVYRTVRAVDIWNKLIHSGFMYNDPGLLMLDEVNKYNNGYYMYDIACTNPCGEIPLPPFGVCDLGNINLTKYVKKPFDICVEGKELLHNFDLAAYQKDIATAVRFLDNVLDVSEYPYQEIADRAQGDRRIGLNGVAGLGSALAMLRIPYDSPEAIQKAVVLQKICTEAAYSASIELAKEKGSFPNFDKEKYLEAPFIKSLPSHIQSGIAEHGIRNLAILTIPPVGTGSLLAGNISNGLEPIFALEYNRTVRQPDQSAKVEAVEDYAWGLFKKTEERNPACIPPDFFKTSREISPKAHIDMQAALQKHIDGSISKTVNMPESITVKEYEETLWYAVESGCKGFTSFREGTREGVLNVKEDKKQKAEPKVEEKVKAAEPKKKRQRKLTGATYKITDDAGNIYVTINDIEEKGKVRPFEIFVNANGAASNKPMYEALAKVMSAVMRRTDDCRFLVKDLQSIYGANGFFSDGRYHQSHAQMIGNILEEHIRSLDPEESKEVKMAKCPSCGEAAYSNEGGCGKCLACGFSKCG